MLTEVNVNRELTFEPRPMAAERESSLSCTAPPRFWRKSSIYRNLIYDTFSEAGQAFEEARKLGMVPKVFVQNSGKSYRLQVRLLKDQKERWNRFARQQFGAVNTPEDEENLASLLFALTQRAESGAR